LNTDANRVLEDSLPLIRQLSYVSQKGLVLDIIRNCSADEIPRLVLHINKILRNVADEEKAGDENLRYGLIKGRVDLIEKKDFQTILEVMEDAADDPSSVDGLSEMLTGIFKG
jgi:hypothetical protein